MNLKNSIQLQWKKSIKLWWLMVMGGIFTFENHHQNFNGHFQKNYSSKKRLLKVGLGLLALNNKNLLANGQYSSLEQYNFTTNFNEDSLTPTTFDLKGIIASYFTLRNVDGSVCSMTASTASDIPNLSFLKTDGSTTCSIAPTSNNLCQYNANVNDPHYGKLCHPSSLKNTDICNTNNCIIKTPLSFNKDVRCGYMMDVNGGEVAGSTVSSTVSVTSLVANFINSLLVNGDSIAEAIAPVNAAAVSVNGAFITDAVASSVNDDTSIAASLTAPYPALAYVNWYTSLLNRNMNSVEIAAMVAKALFFIAVDSSSSGIILNGADIYLMPLIIDLNDAAVNVWDALHEASDPSNFSTSHPTVVNLIASAAAIISATAPAFAPAAPGAPATPATPPVDGTANSKATATFTIPQLTDRVKDNIKDRVRFLKSWDLRSGEITELTTLKATAPANKAVTIAGLNINRYSPYFGDFCYVNTEGANNLNLQSSMNPLSLKTVSDITSKGLSLTSGATTTSIFSVYVPKIYSETEYQTIESPYSANHQSQIGLTGKEKVFTRISQGMTKSSRLEYLSLENNTYDAPNEYSVFKANGMGYDDKLNIMGYRNNITFDFDKSLSFSHDYLLPLTNNQLHRNFELTNIMNDAFFDGFQLVYNKDTKESSLISYFDNNEHVKISVKSNGEVIASNLKLSVKKNDAALFNSVSMKMFKKLLSATKITSLFNSKIINPNINEGDLNLMTSFLKGVFRNQFITIYLRDQLNLSMEILSEYDWNKILNDLNEEVKNDSMAMKSAKIFNFLFHELNYNNFVNLPSADIIRTKFLNHSIKIDKVNLIKIVRLIHSFLNDKLILGPNTLSALTKSPLNRMFYPQNRDFTNSFLKEAFETDTTKAEIKSKTQHDKYFKSLENDVLYNKYITHNIKKNDYILPMTTFINDISMEFINFVDANFDVSISFVIDDRVLQNFLMENLFNRFIDASCKTNLLIINDLNQDIYDVPTSMNVFKLKADDTVKKNPNKNYNGSVKKDLMKLADDYVNDGKVTNPSSNLIEDTKSAVNKIEEILSLIKFSQVSGTNYEILLNAYFINSVTKALDFMMGSNSNLYHSLNKNQLGENYNIIQNASILNKEFTPSFNDYDLELQNNINKIKNIFNILLDENCEVQSNEKIKIKQEFILMNYQIDKLICNLDKYQGKNEEFRVFIFDIFKTLEDTLNASFPGQEELILSQEFIYDLINNIKNLELDKFQISDLYNKLKSLNPLMTHLHLPFQNNPHWLSHIEDVQLWYNYLMEYHNDNETQNSFFNHDIIKANLDPQKDPLIFTIFSDNAIFSYLELMNRILLKNNVDNNIINFIFNKDILFLQSDLIDINENPIFNIVNDKIQSVDFSGSGIYYNNNVQTYKGQSRLLISQQALDTLGELANSGIHFVKSELIKIIEEIVAKDPDVLVGEIIKAILIKNKLISKPLKWALNMLKSKKKRILGEETVTRYEFNNDLDSLKYCITKSDNRLFFSEDISVVRRFYLALLVLTLISSIQHVCSILKETFIKILYKCNKPNSLIISKISKRYISAGTIDGVLERMSRHYYRFFNKISLVTIGGYITVVGINNEINHCVKNSPMDSGTPTTLLVLESVNLVYDLLIHAYRKSLYINSNKINDKGLMVSSSMEVRFLSYSISTVTLILAAMGINEYNK
jgi:hypothetical protein